MRIIALTIEGPNENPIAISGPRGIQTGGLDSLVNILATLIAFVFMFAIIFSLFMLIYGGWQWMTSAGDKQKVQQARQRLTFVIVGLIIVLSSFFVLTILGTFLGVNLLKLP